MQGRIQTTARLRMVEQVSTEVAGLNNRVLFALCKVARHLFLAPRDHGVAYKCQSCAVPGIPGDIATVSDPRFVALMTDVLQLSGDSVVLDIGAGTGYHAAVNAELCRAVYGVEICPELAARANSTLRRLGYRNVQIKYGDGANGLPKCAPYDAINVACAVPRIPEPLLEQLKIGGRMVVPVFKMGDERRHELVKVTKIDNDKYEYEVLRDAVFVPMT